jgi:hypothetical protein
LSVAWRDLVRELLRDPEVRDAAREIFGVLKNELMVANEGDEWFDQKHGSSVLGRNKWINAVRARLDRDPNDPHARIVGDRYLLDTVGISEERDRVHRSRPQVRKAPAPTVETESPHAARALRLLRGEK